MKSATGREQGRELQLGTKPPTCPGPGRDLAWIYLESLGHRVRRQRPGGGCREAKNTSLQREPEEQTGRTEGWGGWEHRDRCGRRGVSAWGGQPGPQGQWGTMHAALQLHAEGVTSGGASMQTTSTHTRHQLQGLTGPSPALPHVVTWASSGRGILKAISEHHPPCPPGALAGSTSRPTSQSHQLGQLKELSRPSSR